MPKSRAIFPWFRQGKLLILDQVHPAAPQPTLHLAVPVLVRRLIQRERERAEFPRAVRRQAPPAQSAEARDQVTGKQEPQVVVQKTETGGPWQEPELGPLLGLGR